MLKLSSFIMASALFISGCATKPLTPIEQSVQIRTGVSALTIIAPQDQYLPASALSALVSYDYFLDCMDDRCRAGKMHSLQYITIYSPAGAHILYVKQANDGIIETGNVFDVNTTASVSFMAQPSSRQFISHEWKFSIASFAGPFSSSPSTLTMIDESAGQLKLQKVLDTTSIFGNKMMGYGDKGIVYQP